jgi:hypothetical protein
MPQYGHVELAICSVKHSTKKAETSSNLLSQTNVINKQRGSREPNEKWMEEPSKAIHYYCLFAFKVQLGISKQRDNAKI